MLIHFVCKGNTYRSRLAGTYLNLRQIPNLKATSSGIEAKQNISGIITWEAQRIIQNNKLTDFESHVWHETTKELLDKADLVVFMQQMHHKYCKEKLGFRKKNFKIFNVKDFGDYGFGDEYVSLEDDIERIKLSEKTFEEIKEKVDNLVRELGF
ncbi:MAG: hypothetical protein CO135_02670 [Candidatus Levybacteria bacterium CG_4_9_14_3_um_filter_35_16]|nr:MAG: hypothetical protein COX78_01755 [Candidatus Levybacteria bacterium CG_4_10_14_0_2_um_filter_35_8]PJA91165.1 MAG: hypothetical protein CO135_02670 [Candidatus Levybacteria bacterium CG_4_9_14_3_um_filter_35_16]PJC54043.1 MAG: hypothetical protein CO028_04500 [Candidatus Levybacteria bacterium CG_4_9_14_0_2_um_filter_35_21]